MKKIILTVACCFGLFWAQSFGVLAAEIQQMDPPFWWTGMKNTTLQVMVHGPGISANEVSVNYRGVTLKDVVKTSNPNYLFLYFDISDNLALSVQPFARNYALPLAGINHGVTLSLRF